METATQGERLREARQRLGLGQVDLADLIGVPQSNLSPWENGLRPIPKPVLLAVSKVCKISFGWLSSGNGPFTEGDETVSLPLSEAYSEHLPTRLALARGALNLSRLDLARILGMSKGDVELMEEGIKPISTAVALALEHIYHLNHLWLLGGGEWMWADEPSDAANSSGQNGSDPDILGGLLDVPVIEGAEGFGPGGVFQAPGPTFPTYPLARSLALEALEECGPGFISDLFMTECVGDSMRPTIRPGDQVLLNAALPLRLKPRRGALYLVRLTPTSQDVRIKRVQLDPGGKLRFSSDAAGFGMIEVDLAEWSIEDLLLGRVCWISRWPMRDEAVSLNW